MKQGHLILVGMMAAAAAMTVSGCATTNVTKTTQAAPITYKIGQGDAKYASLARPTLPNRSRPSPYTAPPAIKSVPMPKPGRSFDQASVNADLYKHQKVGKRYTVLGQTYTPRHNPKYDKTGEASWYGPKFNGKPTATGEKFNMNELTAAHRTLPLNSMLFVTNLENGRTLMVRLNDRGPFAHNRIIDLSKASAEALGITSQGVAKVRVQYAGPADPMAAFGSVLPKPAKPVPFPQENFVEAPQYVAPQAQQPLFDPSPLVPAPIAPQSPERIAPEAQEDGGDVTLTIKGPIHVASYNARKSPPRVIPAVYRTQK